MFKKHNVIGFAVLLLPILMNAVSKEEEELQKKTIWQLYIDLKMPGLKPEVFQWALFDEDPAIGYKSAIVRMRSYIDKRIADAEDEKAKKSAIKSWMGVAWRSGFKEIEGDKVYLWTKEDNKGPSLTSNEPDSRKWLVTKIVYVKKEPVCWAIPFDTKIGQETRVILNKENVFDLRQAFDDAMSASFEGTPEKSTVNNYPRDTTFKDDSDAHALYNKMVDAIQGASTLYYESEVQYGREGDKPNKSSYNIWLKKPNYARIETFEHKNLRGTLVGDGDYFWIYWANRRPQFNLEDVAEYVKTCSTSYMKVLSPLKRHSIWHQFSYLGTHLVAFEQSMFHGCPDGLGEYLDGVRSIGTENIGGEDCYVLEVSYMANQRSKYYWISKKDFLPRQVREVARVEFNLVTTETWKNIRVDLDIPDEKFKWQPPDNWTEWFMPDESKAFIQVGTVAPDFEFTGIDGKKIKLSDFIGKVVVLNFWRVGCPPCREEIPHLVKIYDKYKNNGLMVIGFNSADDHKTAIDLLNQYSAGYPNIVNSTQAAMDICFNVYQTMKGYSAVPLNYIIDREGKIADAWYGFDAEEVGFLEKKLEPLGFK